MDTADSAKVELETLIGLFFADVRGLGRFREVKANEMLEPFPSLLAHDFHMTVTLEKFHSSSVDVKVLDSRKDDGLYSRKILLSRQSDGRVVQYGIVRLNLGVLNDDVIDEIQSESTPLGRILISHDVLRRVKLLSLYEIECGEELADSLDVQLGEIVYGRTALIYLNEKPAIELLEIVVA